MSVFVTKGMSVSIPAGGLQIGVDATGAPFSSVRIQVGLALYPVWAEIALDHLLKSQKARGSLTAAILAKESDDRKASYLESEFLHGMQSMTASATAIDSFYASVKKFASFPKVELEAMRTNRTSRPDRIKETFRRVFRLSTVNTSEIDKILTTIYRFRDWSVHPPADQRDPIFHSELNAGVEWRFVAFSSSNAKEALRGTLLLLSRMCAKGEDSQDEALQKHCAESRKLFELALNNWAKAFGPLSGDSS